MEENFDFQSLIDYFRATPGNIAESAWAVWLLPALAVALILILVPWHRVNLTGRKYKSRLATVQHVSERVTLSDGKRHFTVPLSKIHYQSPQCGDRVRVYYQAWWLVGRRIRVVRKSLERVVDPPIQIFAPSARTVLDAPKDPLVAQLRSRVHAR